MDKEKEEVKKILDTPTTIEPEQVPGSSAIIKPNGKKKSEIKVTTTKKKDPVFTMVPSHTGDYKLCKDGEYLCTVSNTAEAEKAMRNLNREVIKL